MPALNFQKRFASLVESGRKTQTIRAFRKDGRNPRPGQTLYLYVGQRTKGCRKLGEAECIAVDAVTITEDGIVFTGGHLSAEAADRMAEADGFRDFVAMRLCFLIEHGLPFDGLCIRWKRRP